MSHKEQIEFVSQVKKKYPNSFYNKCVVEIGSLDINGSVRQFFGNCVYVGVDVGPGPGVDVVSLGHQYKMSNSFDVVISCECFEHDPHWKDTFLNMIDLCKPGGLVLFTCATIGRKEHGTIDNEPQSSPLTVNIGWNYYKNLTKENFINHFNLSDYFENFEFSDNMTSFDLYFSGIKKMKGG